MTKTSFLARMRSVNLSYEAGFPTQETGAPSALLRKLIGKSVNAGSLPGHYESSLFYGENRELPVKGDVESSGEGYKMHIHITASQSAQMPRIRATIRQCADEAGATFSDTTRSFSIL